MIKSLNIQNFRCLSDFQIESLSQVNLLVGKNNSGKSTVLEALRVYCSGASRAILEIVSHARGEPTGLIESSFNDETMAPFESLFTGRAFPILDEAKIIKIGEIGNDENAVKIMHAYLVDSEEEYTLPTGETTTRKKRRVLAPGEELGDDTVYQALLSSKGFNANVIRLDRFENRLRRMLATGPDGNGIPCGFVSTRYESMDDLANEWDRIALTDDQVLVKNALKLIYPEFEDLAFVRTENSGERKLLRGARVRLSNSKRPVPLTSLGDGTLRVFQLALRTFSARNGMLLVDEFENGLHYSVQDEIWEMVFELASRNNFQVFATTHSRDSIQSFSRVASSRPETGTLIRVGQSIRSEDEGRIISTVLDENDLRNMTAIQLEIR